MLYNSMKLLFTAVLTTVKLIYEVLNMMMKIKIFTIKKRLTFTSTKLENVRRLILLVNFLQLNIISIRLRQ